MEWLKQIAPLVGTALGGPLGGVAAALIDSLDGIHSPFGKDDGDDQ